MYGTVRTLLSLAVMVTTLVIMDLLVIEPLFI